MERLSGLAAAFPKARAVKRATGKPVWHQMAEMLRLRLGDGKLMPHEYFDLGLYDDRRFDGEAKRRFVGQWAKDDIYRANEGKWHAIGDDKLVAYLLFAGLGAPYPKVFAVYHPTRSYPARLLRTADDVARYLRSAPYPLFAKPADGGLAWSAYLLRGYDAVTDTLQLGDGRALAVADFVPDCTRWEAGMIFQELIVPHAEVVELCGPRVATTRLYVLNGAEGALLHRAVLRLPTGRNMYDNFKSGKSGNLLAALDDRGRITRVIGPSEAGLGEVDRHPDTGQALVGWQVPNWEHTIATCLTTAAAFPGLRIQAWDVAIAAGGPLFVEMNTRGDLDLIQVVHRKGLVDDRWHAALPGLTK